MGLLNKKEGGYIYHNHYIKRVLYENFFNLKLITEDLIQSRYNNKDF